MKTAVRRAGERYAGVQVSIEARVTRGGGGAAGALAYLPRGDFYAQANLATRNNVYRMLPEPRDPSISDRRPQQMRARNVFGSAVGFLVNWEPFDLGRRKAHVATMDAGQRRAVWGVARTRFELRPRRRMRFSPVWRRTRRWHRRGPGWSGQ